MSKDSSNNSNSYFAGLLTRRHLLARWSFAFVLVVAAVPLVNPWGLVGSPSNIAEDRGGVSPVTEARLLKVEVSEIASVGPKFLSRDFTGVVSARRSGVLASKALARVLDVSFDLGDVVQAGQVVVQLDRDQLLAEQSAVLANIAAAEARLEELISGPRGQDIEQARAKVNELEASLRLGKANFKRTSELYDSRSISKQEFDQSLYQLDATSAQLVSAQKALEQLEEGTRKERIAVQRATVASLNAQLLRVQADLSDRNILAPFSGFVTNRLVDEGAVVSPGQELISLDEIAPYEIRVGLPPESMEFLSESNIRVTEGDQQLVVNVENVATNINQATRTREVILRLSESSSKLVSVGQAVRVSIKHRVESEGFWIPSQALTSGPRGLWAIYVVEPEGPGEPSDVIHRRQVEVLKTLKGWSEISGPVREGERLIVSGVHRVSPGQRVECVVVRTENLAESN